ncbi:hypothetical protein GRS96_17995 [Rathayibacter sp. VKM Ac-2803]|uniref:hypothetical protein n=1 Tax=unclassified Rathayibacter TaxID=2609250 RepID=UPI00135ABC3E|nr:MULTISPECIES: hypothetical protein [unclassified Rathayibacter]MWV51164.1 hypothetical protein [Rathayibacter sp. VKM Ac-2803]MWV57649.1 hypothetical protein [Rathayibacter sp. VKM Ac-2754]
MSARQQDRATGIGEASASPADPTGDPGPGERSGLSSRVADDILSGTDDFGADFAEDEGGGAPGGGPESAEGLGDLRAAEIDDPAQAVGDDPANPIHGSLAEEFEAR